MPSKRCLLSILGGGLALHEINILVSLFLFRNCSVIDGDMWIPTTSCLMITGEVMVRGQKGTSGSTAYTYNA